MMEHKGPKKEEYEESLRTINPVGFELLFKYVKGGNRFTPDMAAFNIMGFNDDINAFYSRVTDEELLHHTDLIYFLRYNWDEKITYNLIWKEAKRRGLK